MSVAKSYAKALFEVGKSKNGKNGNGHGTDFESELKKFHALISENKNVRIALLSPATDVKEKTNLVKVFSEKLGLSNLSTEFLTLLSKRGRLNILPKIMSSFVSVVAEAEGGVVGELISADPMTAADVRSLSTAFAEKLGKPVTFKSTIDPNVMAGIRVLVNGVTYDGTLQTQLQRLRDRLLYSTEASH